MSYTNYNNLSSGSKSSKNHGSLREKAYNKPQRYSPYGSGPKTSKKEGTVPTIFVGNLAPDITEDILIDVFKDCGEMKEVRLKRHADTGKVKGFGFIDFYQMSCAYNAIEEKNGVVVLGRPLQVELSLSRQQEKKNDTRVPSGVMTQPLPPQQIVKQELNLETLNMLSHLQQAAPFLKPNYHMSQPSIVNNPSQYGNIYKHQRGDTEFISKRSTDRVEQPQRERPPGCMTVFIGNLLNDVKEEDIREIFRDCSIKDVRWLFDSKSGTKKFKGCGFVDFNDVESTIKAAQLNGCLVLGRPMRVDYASDSKKKTNQKHPQSDDHSGIMRPPYMGQNPYSSQLTQSHGQPYTTSVYSGIPYQNLSQQPYIPSTPIQIPPSNQIIQQPQNITQTQSMSQSPIQGNQRYIPSNQPYFQ